MQAMKSFWLYRSQCQVKTDFHLNFLVWKEGLEPDRMCSLLDNSKGQAVIVELCLAKRAFVTKELPSHKRAITCM